MVEHTFVLQAEERFANALKIADVQTLHRWLDEDFVLIDLSGRVLNRAALIALLQSGELRFQEIRVIDSEVRLYGETAIVTGETEMRGQSKGQPFQVQSRYTHVYQEQADDSFLLVSAQGTIVSPAAHP
jgi:ketosteroid isomerase-like protein